jgi:hypothetical protein
MLIMVSVVPKQLKPLYEYDSTPGWMCHVDLQCRMLKVATGKLKLEHLVIEKGQFKQEQDTMKTTLKVRRARISCACSDSLLEITSLYFGF